MSSLMSKTVELDKGPKMDSQIERKIEPPDMNTSRSSRPRRPDRAVYVPPRAKRPSIASSSEDNTDTSPKISSKQKAKPSDNAKISASRKQGPLCSNNNPMPEEPRNCESKLIDPLDINAIYQSPKTVDEKLVSSDDDNQQEKKTVVFSSQQDENNSNSNQPVGYIQKLYSATELSTSICSTDLNRNIVDDCVNLTNNLYTSFESVEGADCATQDYSPNEVNLGTPEPDFLLNRSRKSDLLDTSEEVTEQSTDLSTSIRSHEYFSDHFTCQNVDDFIVSRDSTNSSSFMTNETDESDNWESFYDENGECVDPAVMTELTAAVGDVEIDRPKYNYLEFKPFDPDVTASEYSHIVELYDFPAEYKTQDLMLYLSQFKDRGLNIQWVDDTHALAIFNSPLTAAEALEMRTPFIKARPVSEGVSASKWKVKSKGELLLPHKPRPETSATIARRLVSSALGLKVQVSREQRDLEKKRMVEAKEKRRQAIKLKQDIWNGSVT